MKKLLTLLSIVVFSMMGCEKPTEITDWLPVDGQVLDEQTDAPVAGAHVIALYDGVATWTTSVCFHVENATTDDDGRFRIPAWTNTGMYRTVEDQSFSIYAYKPGYRESDRTYKEQSYKRGIYYVVTDSNSIEGRATYILTKARQSNCRHAGENQRNLYPLHRALLTEATENAVLNSNPKDINWLREVAAGKAIATDEELTQREWDMRVNEFLRENLK